MPFLFSCEKKTLSNKQQFFHFISTKKRTGLELRKSHVDVMRRKQAKTPFDQLLLTIQFTKKMVSKKLFERMIKIPQLTCKK